MPKSTKFVVKDTTGDGVHEPIIDTDYNISSAIVDITYTYYKGKVTLASVSNHGKMTVYKKGTVSFKAYLNRGCLIQNWFKIVKGKDKIPVLLLSNRGQTDHATGYPAYICIVIRKYNVWM